MLSVEQQDYLAYLCLIAWHNTDHNLFWNHETVKKLKIMLTFDIKQK